MGKNIFNFNFKGNKHSPDENTGYQKEWRDQIRKKRNRQLKKFGIFLCILAVAGGITYYINWVNYNSRVSEMRAELANSTPTPEVIVATPAPTPIDYESLPRRLELSYRANNDTVGYLYLEGTKLDFPVVRGEDNYFYQNRNYNKRSNEYGCVYMLTECDPAKTRHLVLNGPNNDDGSMFADLAEYLNEGFFYSHQYITFETMDGKSNWQVFSVHFANENFNHEDVVFEDNVEYLAYINIFKTMSKYDTTIELEAKDQILTMATKYYDNENGYLMVHAKMIN